MEMYECFSSKMFRKLLLFFVKMCVFSFWFLFLRAIGNAPWPVGVTRSGIHQRPGSSKAYVSNVAHVMNDETQRKYENKLKTIVCLHFASFRYIHGLKRSVYSQKIFNIFKQNICFRIMTKCQEFFPADPSKCMEFVKNKSILWYKIHLKMFTLHFSLLVWFNIFSSILSEF